MEKVWRQSKCLFFLMMIRPALLSPSDSSSILILSNNNRIEHNNILNDVPIISSPSSLLHHHPITTTTNSEHYYSLPTMKYIFPILSIMSANDIIIEEEDVPKEENNTSGMFENDTSSSNTKPLFYKTTTAISRARRRKTFIQSSVENYKLTLSSSTSSSSSTLTLLCWSWFYRIRMLIYGLMVFIWSKVIIVSYQYMTLEYPLLFNSFLSATIAAFGDLLAQKVRYIQQQQYPNNNSTGINEEENDNDQDDDMKRIRSNDDDDDDDDDISNDNILDMRRMVACAIEGAISAPLLCVAYDILEGFIPVAINVTSSSTASTSTSSSSLLLSSSTIQQWINATLHVIVDTIFLDTIWVGVFIIITCILEMDQQKQKHRQRHQHERRIQRQRLIIRRILCQIYKELTTEFIPSVKASWLCSLCLSPIQILTFRYLPVEARVLAVNIQDIMWSGVVSYMAHRSRNY